MLFILAAGLTATCVTANQQWSAPSLPAAEIPMSTHSGMPNGQWGVPAQPMTPQAMNAHGGGMSSPQWAAPAAQPMVEQALNTHGGMGNAQWAVPTAAQPMAPPAMGTHSGMYPAQPMASPTMGTHSAMYPAQPMAATVLDTRHSMANPQWGVPAQPAVQPAMNNRDGLMDFMLVSQMMNQGSSGTSGTNPLTNYMLMQQFSGHPSQQQDPYMQMMLMNQLVGSTGSGLNNAPAEAQRDTQANPGTDPFMTYMLMSQLSGAAPTYQRNPYLQMMLMNEMAPALGRTGAAGTGDVMNLYLMSQIMDSSRDSYHQGPIPRQQVFRKRPRSYFGYAPERYVPGYDVYTVTSPGHHTVHLDLRSADISDEESTVDSDLTLELRAHDVEEMVEVVELDANEDISAQLALMGFEAAADEEGYFE